MVFYIKRLQKEMDILFASSISVTNLHENIFTFYTTINDITHVTSINAVFIPHQPQYYATINETTAIITSTC